MKSIWVSLLSFYTCVRILWSSLSLPSELPWRDSIESFKSSTEFSMRRVRFSSWVRRALIPSTACIRFSPSSFIFLSITEINDSESSACDWVEAKGRIGWKRKVGESSSSSSSSSLWWWRWWWLGFGNREKSWEWDRDNSVICLSMNSDDLMIVCFFPLNFPRFQTEAYGDWESCNWWVTWVKNQTEGLGINCHVWHL